MFHTSHGERNTTHVKDLKTGPVTSLKKGKENELASPSVQPFQPIHQPSLRGSPSAAARTNPTSVHAGPTGWADTMLVPVITWGPGCYAGGHDQTQLAMFKPTCHTHLNLTQQPRELRSTARGRLPWAGFRVLTDSARRRAWR